MSTEAKFRITDPGIFWSLQTIEKLAVFSLSAPQLAEIDDTYLDTKKRKLFTAGYYLRRRNQAKEFLITLNQLRSAEETSENPKKWHVLLKKNKNAPEDWPKSEVRKRVRKIILDKKLRSILTLHQTRITRLISKKDKAIAQAILDDVSIIENKKDQQFKTLKIRILIPGGGNHLKTIIDNLQKKWNLELEPLTKFERAIAIEMNKNK